jgi:hypothetical protein
MNQPATKQKAKKEVRDIRAEALKIARTIKIDGQAVGDSKIIATGIQRGMEMFLRQQAEKSRDLDKRLKKAKQQATRAVDAVPESAPELPLATSRLPWVLLAASWVIFTLVAIWQFKG